jgi:hypothetical protein
LIAAGTVALPALVLPARAQEETAATNETAVTDQRYLSASGRIYKHEFWNRKDHGRSLRVQVRAKAAFHQFSTLDELLDLDRFEVSSIGLLPRIEAEFPVAGLDDVYFLPTQEFAFWYETEGDSPLPSFTTTLMLRYYTPGEHEDLSVSMAGRYGSKYAEDGINLHDYVSVFLEVATKHYLGVRLGKYKFIFTPYGKATYYTDELEFEVPGTDGVAIDTRYEIGGTFGTDPRWRIWRVKMPRVRITYDFSGDLSGIRIKI